MFGGWLYAYKKWKKARQAQKQSECIRKSNVCQPQWWYLPTEALLSAGKAAKSCTNIGVHGPIVGLIYLPNLRLDSFFLTGRGGRVAAHGGTLSSFIVKNIALDKTDDSNPRQAILRHAKEAAENPYWVAPAYKK